jgi:hypothetical protein
MPPPSLRHPAPFSPGVRACFSQRATAGRGRSMVRPAVAALILEGIEACELEALELEALELLPRPCHAALLLFFSWHGRRGMETAERGIEG